MAAQPPIASILNHIDQSFFTYMNNLAPLLKFINICRLGFVPQTPFMFLVLPINAPSLHIDHFYTNPIQ